MGWSKLIHITKAKVRRSISLIKSFKIFGCSSPKLRLALFYTFVFPIFSWIFPIFPLFTSLQQRSLSHFYYASLRRLLSCLHLNNILFSFCLDFPSLEDRCFNYWTRFLLSLSDSIDGNLFLEQAIHSSLRNSWLNKDFRIKCLHRNKRLLPCSSILESVMSWLSSVPRNSSVPVFEINDIELLQLFPETFLLSCFFLFVYFYFLFYLSLSFIYFFRFHFFLS